MLFKRCGACVKINAVVNEAKRSPWRDTTKSQEEVPIIKSSKTKDDKNTPNSESGSSSLERAGLWTLVGNDLRHARGYCRRDAAMVMIVTLVVMLKNGALDLQGYAEPADLIQASFGYKLLIQTWVGLWIAGFFLWFWRRGGQTLGMRMAFANLQHG